jgi:hypothetical protein
MSAGSQSDSLGAMKTWLAGAFGFAFLSLAGAQALPAANTAADLARAMRLDEFLANRRNSAAVKVHQMNKSEPARLVCAASAFKAGEFTAQAPKVLEALFSPAELAEGLKFYESSLGQQWVAYTFDVFQAQDTGAARKVKLARKEIKKVDAFMATDLGARIGNMAYISGSDVVRDTFGNVVMDAIKRCPAQGR